MTPASEPKGASKAPGGERARYQVKFDGGHQQRYLPDWAAVLRYVLAIGPRAASPRFEVFAEAGEPRLADGSPGGRRFELAEVIDLARPGEADRLRAELSPPSEPKGAAPPGPTSGEGARREGGASKAPGAERGEKEASEGKDERSA